MSLFFSRTRTATTTIKYRVICCLFSPLGGIISILFPCNLIPQGENWPSFTPTPFLLLLDKYFLEDEFAQYPDLLWWYAESNPHHPWSKIRGTMLYNVSMEFCELFFTSAPRKSCTISVSTAMMHLRFFWGDWEKKKELSLITHCVLSKIFPLDCSGGRRFLFTFFANILLF